MSNFPITRRAAAIGLGSSLGAATLGAVPALAAGQKAPQSEPARRTQPGARPLKIIGLEEHFATPEIVAAWGKVPFDEREPSIELIQATGYDKFLYHLSEERFAIMDAMGIDMHVLSLNTPGAQCFAPDVGTPIARESNDMVAELVRKHPTRYQGFGTLATADAKAAAKEVDRCAGSLGLNGILMNGRTGDRNIDHPDFLPIFEAAAARNFPIYIHPQSPVAPVRDAYYNGVHPSIDPVFNISGLGWHYETGVQAVRLVLSGVFDRFPNLQIILGHWGEVILFYLERIDLMSKIAMATKLLKRPISDYFKTNFHVTPAGIYSQRYFRWSREVLGIDRIMFSSDYPYHIDHEKGAQKFLQTADITDAEREAVAHGNWDKLCASIKR
jgi:predicted TIM-barrel fold metal-dependent hydrolase